MPKRGVAENQIGNWINKLYHVSQNCIEFRCQTEYCILRAILSLRVCYAWPNQPLNFFLHNRYLFNVIYKPLDINSFGVNCSGGGQKIKAQPPLHKRCKGEGKIYTIS